MSEHIWAILTISVYLNELDIFMSSSFFTDSIILTTLNRNDLLLEDLGPTFQKLKELALSLPNRTL